MGRLVNVVLPSGRVVAVDEEVANASQLSRDTLQQEALGEQQRLNEERSSGLVEGAKAAGEGFLDTTTFGLYGGVRGYLDEDYRRNSRIRGEERAGSRFVGDVAGLVVPFGAGSIARGAGEVATELGGKFAGRAAEGAIFGTGGYIAGTNVTGDPLTIEAAVESAGLGALMEVGIGAAADKLEGMAWDRKLRTAKNKVLAEDLEVAKKGAAVFKDTPPSWSEFVESHESAAKASSQLNKEIAKEAKAYEAYTTKPDGLNGTLREFDKTRADVMAEVQRDPAVRNAVSAHDEATTEFTRANREYEKVRKNDDVFTDRLNKIKEALADKRNDYAPRGVDGLYEKKVAGYQGKVVGERFVPAKKGTFYKGRPKQPISEKLDNELKDYNKRLDEVYRLKSAGDIEGAIKAAAPLRDDVARQLYGRKLPKIVDKPVAPTPPQLVASGRNADLVNISREITRGTEEARALMREGKYQEAAGQLTQLRDTIGSSAKDLTLPEIPPVPREFVPELKGSLPKSLEEFSRKHADAVSELATQGFDPASQAALGRVMQDIGLEASGNASTDLASLHNTLRKYRDGIDSIKAEAAKQAVDEAQKPMLLKLLNRAARYAGGRVFDVGGAIGAVTRTLGGEAVGKAMTGVEDAVLGGALLESRNGIKARVRNLVEKYGSKSADVARKLAPPLAYLKQSFPSGEKDPETDLRKAAVNRIHELHQAAMTAPDTAFMAVQGLLGHPGDVGFKMHQHIVGTLQYLVGTLPRDNGLDTQLFQSNWTPQWHEAVAMAHRLEAVHDPVTAIARAIAGDSHPAATEALWAVYPSIMNELAQELSVAAPTLQKLTYEQASAYSNLFRTPLTGLQQPVVVTTIQGLYMTGPQASAPQTGRPPGGAARAPGRPAAVQSPVAGSSPTNLTGR